MSITIPPPVPPPPPAGPPPIRRGAPVPTPDRKSGARAPDTERWQAEAESGLATEFDEFFSMLAPAMQGQQGDGDGRQDDDGGQSGQEQPSPVETEAPPSEQLVTCVRFVGSLVGQLARQPQAQTQWSARIPLDPQLLPDTVLHLGYSPLIVTLHFETQDWQVRGLISPHTRAFEQVLMPLLAPGCEIAVTI